MDFIFWIIWSILIVVPFWVICSKIGIHPALSLLTLVPLIGIMVVLYVIAFGRWPNAEAA
jgi:hypothetical protein